MNIQRIEIQSIPALVYGETSEKVYLAVHGKLSRKEEAADFAQIATARGYQVLSFDLPDHGERNGKGESCDVWTGVRDLSIVGEYVRERWSEINLYACSLGAYLSLLTYREYPIKRCLLLSPILDMTHLIENMMLWFNVDKKTLQEQKRVPTPIGEPLDWEYYQYTKEHPIDRWNPSTAILYGSQDNLTERFVVDAFVSRFDCNLTVLEGGEHYFHTDEQLAFFREWVESSL